MNRKLIGIILLILTFSMLFSSCIDTSTGEESATDTTAAPNNAIDLAQYKIIRPDNADKTVIDAAVLLKNTISTSVSVQLELGTDWIGSNEEHDNNTREILIGQTNYSQTTEALTDITRNDFAVVILEKKIVITGGSSQTTYSAVQYFCENYITYSEGKPILNNLENYTMKYDYLYEELDVKVVSLNVLTATNATKNQQAEREPRIISFVEEYKPDSLGVQECEIFWRMRLDVVLEGYARAQKVTEVTKNYIYYRTDKLKVIDSGVFWLSETPDVSSKGFGSRFYISCCWALFESLENGSRYVHMNTHLNVDSEEIRVKELTVLLPKAQEFMDLGYAVVLTGDFNAVEDSVIYSTVTSTELKSARYLTKDTTSIGTFNGLVEKDIYKGPIDYCFVNKEALISKYRVVVKQDGGFMSDHNALYTEMKIYSR